MIDGRFPAGKLITCILPQGHALGLMEKLKKEKGITTMSFHHARGAGRSGHSRRGIGHYVENNILTIAVSEEQADDIFEFVFMEAGISEDHRGIVFMERLNMLTPFELPEELKGK